MEAQYPSRSRRTATIVLLIALLLHLLFLAYLLILQHHDQSYELKLQALRELALAKAMANKQKNPQQKEETFEWFSGDARPSPAPVIFHEEPAAPDAQDLAQPLEAAQATDAQPQEKQEEVQQTTAQEVEKPQEKIEEMKSESQTTISINEPAENQVKKAEVQKEVAENQETKKSADAKAMADKQTENAQKQQVQKKQPSQQQKKLSLADIAQGLISKLDENSQHYVSSKGGNKGQPTDEQIKYERYIGKLFACMQKSIRIHKGNLNLDSFLEAEVYFQLTLNRNGSLADVHIIQTSGNRTLDEFILFVVRDAASSFPPVPSYLKQSSYPLGFVINPGPSKPMINFSYY